VNRFYSWVGQIRAVLDIPLLKLGGTEITLWSFLYFILLLTLLYYIADKVRGLLVRRVLAHTNMGIGAQQAVAAITRYVVLFLGLLIILQTVGINLTTLNVLAGAIGIGVGFGLQNIASNFISGLIILFERPVKVGDRIVVGNVEGDVVEIGARSTTVMTNDNIAIIVPNSKFVSENIVNLKHRDNKVRFRVPVTVAYGSDVQLIERLLIQVAKEDPDVLDTPEPVVRLIALGESGLKIELRVWSTTLVHRKGKLISSLNFAIYNIFNIHRIKIPYQQPDLHFYNPPGPNQPSVSSE
jgi:small-conductance mechanosensitive channel